MIQGTSAPERARDRLIAYEARTVAQVLAGDLPDVAAGVFFREAELLICRRHLTAANLAGVDPTEAGVVVWGFADCDVCDRVAELGLAAHEVVMDDAGELTRYSCDDCTQRWTEDTTFAPSDQRCPACGSVRTTALERIELEDQAAAAARAARQGTRR